MQSLVFEDKNLLVFATPVVIISTGLAELAVGTNKGSTRHAVVRNDDTAKVRTKDRGSNATSIGRDRDYILARPKRGGSTELAANVRADKVSANAAFGDIRHSDQARESSRTREQSPCKIVAVDRRLFLEEFF
jgi:hypothetical protein